MKELPVIETRPKGKTKTQRMLIPSEAMVADALWAAPPGQRSDLGFIRQSLADKFGADACCPVTVQRHIVQISRNDSAPFWRVVDPEQPFARRIAGGSERIRERIIADVEAPRGRAGP